MEEDQAGQTHQEGQQIEHGPKVGFWQRVFGPKAEGDDPEEVAEAPAPPSTRNSKRPPEANKPRKQQQTIFDKAEQEQRKRYAKAALMRRERLANAIGERVETVISDRMETGEQKLAKVSKAFNEMNGLLGAIGRNLDTQGERSERIASSIERLPQFAEEEKVVLETIASSLEGQAQSVQGLPEVLALVKQGSAAASHRLAALRSLHDELELQREQRGQVLEVLRESSRKFEERMGDLEETIAMSMAQARTDTKLLRESLETNAQQARDEARLETKREEQRTAHLLEGLQQVSQVIGHGNALAVADTEAHGKAMGSFQEAQDDMLAILQQSQMNTLEEMRRLQEEAKEREETLARRNRVALVGSAGFLSPSPHRRPWCIASTR